MLGRFPLMLMIAWAADAFLAQPIAAGVKMDTGSDRDALEKQVAEILGDLDCANVYATVMDTLDIALTGRMASPQQREQARSALQRVEGVPAAAVDVSGIRFVAEPFCRILDVVEKDSQSVDSKAKAPRFTLDHPDHRYRIGDALILNLMAPQGLDGFANVIFIDATGEWALMLPHAMGADHRLKDGQTVRIGVPREQRTRTKPAWIIGGPAGQAMVVMLAAPWPIIPDTMVPALTGKDLKGFSDYLAASMAERSATPGLKPGEVWYQYEIIEIEPKS